MTVAPITSVTNGLTSDPSRRRSARSLLIFDLDGTLYFGSDVAPGAVELIGAARDSGFLLRFLTNNSTKTQLQIHERLVGLGIHCSIEEVCVCSQATAQLLAERGVSTAFCIGTAGLLTEMAARGIRLLDEPASAEAFVVGLNPELASCAHLPVPPPDALFVACNRDADYPGTAGVLLPGCGALVDTVEQLAGRKADVVVGKPEPYMLELVASEAGVGPERTTMIGDSWASDVCAGLRFGASVILVGEGDSSGGDTLGGSVSRAVDLFDVARLLRIEVHGI